MADDLTEKELSSTVVYNGKILDLRVDDVQLPDGGRAKREYVCHRGGASVLPVDDEGNAYLVRQFRYPYREVITEIPAGKLEKGEDPQVTAVRELQEETGFKCKDVQLLGVLYPTPAYTNEKLYVYLATGLTQAELKLDEDEFLNVVKMPVTELIDLVINGQIHDAKTCYAALKYALGLNKS
ncbi:MAG: NUDIX hydrolase [Clostridia bacterium]|nr:NUDIX hydrolase [Clostridia bacterium]